MANKNSHGQLLELAKNVEAGDATAVQKLTGALLEKGIGWEKILNEVWGYDSYPTTRTVDTFIHNLRQKMEDDPAKSLYLITVPWSGYKFKK